MQLISGPACELHALIIRVQLVQLLCVAVHLENMKIASGSAMAARFHAKLSTPSEFCIQSILSISTTCS